MIRQSSTKQKPDSKGNTIIQLIKFCVVGVSNTIVSYLIELLCYYIIFVHEEFSGVRNLCASLNIHLSSDNARIVITSIIAFVISVTNSYYWNHKHVFTNRSEKSFRQHLITYLKMMACYALTGLLLSPWLKTIFVAQNIPYWIATLLVLFISVPLNYVLNKVWAFRANNNSLGQIKEE